MTMYFCKILYVLNFHSSLPQIIIVAIGTKRFNTQYSFIIEI